MDKILLQTTSDLIKCLPDNEDKENLKEIILFISSYLKMLDQLILKLLNNNNNNDIIDKDFITLLQNFLKNKYE